MLTKSMTLFDWSVGMSLLSGQLEIVAMEMIFGSLALGAMFAFVVSVVFVVDFSIPSSPRGRLTEVSRDTILGQHLTKTSGITGIRQAEEPRNENWIQITSSWNTVSNLPPVKKNHGLISIPIEAPTCPPACRVCVGFISHC